MKKLLLGMLCVLSLSSFASEYKTVCEDRYSNEELCDNRYFLCTETIREQLKKFSEENEILSVSAPGVTTYKKGNNSKPQIVKCVTVKFKESISNIIH